MADAIWNARSTTGRTFAQMLVHVLYDGPPDEVPNRLWDAVSTEEWKIPRVGLSALGEIVGWALPDDFPPRNDRTSKALRSLGYDVQVRS